MKQVQLHDDPHTATPGQYVKAETVAGWPKMSSVATMAFRRFTGVGIDGYNLVRSGNRIFAVGSELAKCMYNHTRQFP
jgi:hypothetical protein